MVRTLCHESFLHEWHLATVRTDLCWMDSAQRFVCGRHAAAHETGDKTLFFAGEEFPEPGIAGSTPGAENMMLPTRAAYFDSPVREEHDFPRGLNGRFHGLAADRARGDSDAFQRPIRPAEAVLSRSQGCFLLCAEAKAILKVVRVALRRPKRPR